MPARWTPRQRWAVRLNAAAPPLRAWALLEKLGPEGLEAASAADWTAYSGGKPEEAAGWRRAALAFDLDAEERGAERLGASLLLRGDPRYSDLLASIHDPPLMLYVQGAFAGGPPVAFVGSRFPTRYGLRMARRLAGEAARAGLTVVSGLAYGIDAESHAAALEAKAPTWAVLGGGLGRVYPAENAALARRIVDGGGAVISERPLNSDLSRGLFPRRNRIVAGLSWATVVVEGRHKSGAGITARAAAENGREVLAVPGPADSALSETPLRLLSQGAGLALELRDILEALPWGLRPGLSEASSPAAGSTAPPPTAEERRVMGLLGSDSLSLDELVQLSGLDTRRISSIMFGLELQGKVTSVPGQRYAQKEAR